MLENKSRDLYQSSTHMSLSCNMRDVQEKSASFLGSAFSNSTLLAKARETS